jgi:hypothetical protein
MRSTYHARSARELVLVTLIGCASLAALACGRTDQSRPDSTGAKAGSAQSTAATVPTTKPSGELLKSMADYENDAKGFAEFVASLRWTGHYYPRDCSGGGCTGSAKAEVLLEAISDANEVKVDNMPQYGVLMARMINIGKVREKHYGIPPGGGEWFFLYYGKPGEMLFNFVKLTFDHQGKPTVIWDRTPHEFAPCAPPDDPNHPKQAQGYAGFTGCEAHPNRQESGVFSLSKNVWISCSLGCCSSEYPGFDSLPEPKMPFGTPKARPTSAKSATSP